MYKLLKNDPQLRPFEKDIQLRMDNYKKTLDTLCGGGTLSDFANGYKYFGFHKGKNGWYYREWAPAAESFISPEIFAIGIAMPIR